MKFCVFTVQGNKYTSTIEIFLSGKSFCMKTTCLHTFSFLPVTEENMFKYIGIINHLAADLFTNFTHTFNLNALAKSLEGVHHQHKVIYLNGEAQILSFYA